ncbi:hypothetical protein EB796_017615 [Bugula neritina]|uniref:Uncharacterized protein n=1 Tax=Bugula neritina TaxID=10212 RepID=A0A7J7JD96_BUGNE|nr:hypothetical protein EB796_017615 [Bugula neritina]
MEVSRVDTCLADSRQQYIQDIFDDFRISSTHAFLLVDVPELPSRFDDLVDILRNIAQLVRQKKLRCLINEVNTISCDEVKIFDIVCLA